MSILGAVHFVTINKALLLPRVCMHHAHAQTHMCTHTCTHTVSGPPPQRAALYHFYRPSGLDRFSFLNLFLPCFLPQLLPVQCPGSPGLAGCTPRQVRFGQRLGVHQALREDVPWAFLQVMLWLLQRLRRNLSWVHALLGCPRLPVARSLAASVPRASCTSLLLSLRMAWLWLAGTWHGE